MSAPAPDPPDPARPPLFIVGCIKTGTTLLLALLDGHPDLLVLPSELNYFRFTEHPSLMPRRKLAHEPAGAVLARKVLDELHFLNALKPERLERLKQRFDVRAQDLHDYSAIDAAAYEAHVEGGEPALSHRALFLRFFEALLASTGRDPETLTRYSLVEKSPLQEEYAPLLSRWFPNARFVHLVRNPYATLRAVRIMGSKAHVKGARERYPYLRELCTMIGRSVRLGQLLAASLPNYCLLRYEDLVLEPEQTMTRVCELLGVAFDPALLEPTLAGRAWGGNSMQRDVLDGIERTVVDRWREDVTPLEVALVDRKLGHVLRDFDYERLEPPSRGRSWLPVRREAPATWVANRVFLEEPGEP